ncbi:HDOD domain-containing protein [bacterium]|nr:HDOD domain-containing protein [bacterium]
MVPAEVYARIESMANLPSLPRTLLSIQNVVSDERSSADDLARVILRDQALTMRVLKVVNSAMYQRRDSGRIRTVRRAVVVIGFESVRKLALGLSVFDMMSKLSRSPLLGEIARHSLLTAGVAQLLAEAGESAAPEEAFLAGLIHDIGKVVLCECSPEGMDAVRRDVRRGTPGLVAEQCHFGVTHDRAGERLARHWRLPPDLQRLIGDHHAVSHDAPFKGGNRLLAVLACANAIAREAGQHDRTAPDQGLVRRCLQRLGIPVSRQEALLAALEQEVVDLVTRLGIEPADLGDYRKIINVEGSVSVAPRQLSADVLATRTSDLLALYQEIGAGLAQQADPEVLRRRVIESAVQILGFERAVLLEVDRAVRRLRPAAWAGVGSEALARALDLPLTRDSGALALVVLEQRGVHAPDAANPAYGDLVGDDLLAAARCRGFAAAPVSLHGSIVGVLYADGGADGSDVVAEQASELDGLAAQLALVEGLGLQPATP